MLMLAFCRLVVVMVTLVAVLCLEVVLGLVMILQCATV